MASDAARTLVLPLTVLVSVAAGVFIGSSLSKRAEPQTSARAETPPTDELAAAMRALTEALERARRDSSELTSAHAVTERTEAAPSKSDIGARELSEAAKQLVAALDHMRSTTSRLGSDGALIEPAVIPDPSLLEAFTPEEVDAQTAPYMMWTYQQVMDRFGKPVRVARGDSNIWWYYRSTSGKTVSFIFQDGRVYEIGCQAPAR